MLIYIKKNFIFVYSLFFRAGLWLEVLYLWPASRLRAVLCLAAVLFAPEPEDWAVCGATRKKPAVSQRRSEFYL